MSSESSYPQTGEVDSERPAANNVVDFPVDMTARDRPGTDEDAVTSGEVSNSPVTNSPVTNGPATSGPVTSGEVSNGAVSKAPVSTVNGPASGGLSSDGEPAGGRDAAHAVPAGTWTAPERGDDGAAGDRKAQGDGRVVKFPKASVKRKRADATGTQPTKSALGTPKQTSEPPSFLASDLLAARPTAANPLRRTIRLGAMAIGGLGAGAVVFAAGMHPLAGLFGVAVIAGLAPVTPQLRGAALAILGLSGVGILGWGRMLEAGAWATPLLGVCTSLAVSSLVFRASHPRSFLARTLVGVSLCGMVVWLGLSGGLDAFSVDSLELRFWLDPLMRTAVFFLCLLTALSLLDGYGSGGGYGFAVAFVAWVFLHGAVSAALLLTEPLGALNQPRVVAAIALPFCVTVASGGLSQLWAVLAAQHATKSRPLFLRKLRGR